MTPEKVAEVIATYQLLFEDLEVEKKEYPHGEHVFTAPDVLGHCYGMLDKMLEFLEEGRMDKVFRWLGFLQGALWVEGIYTLDSLKDHNRSDES